jgi:hypothetical protein
MSLYRTAIDQTARTIDQRAKNFRNQIVTVVILSLASLTWAAVTRSIHPLAGLLLLFPVCGYFLLFDARLLNKWRGKLLQTWKDQQVDFAAFRDAVSATPRLPRNTLDGMLATLPDLGSLSVEQELSGGTREAITSIIQAEYGIRSDALAVKAVGYSVAGASVILAVTAGSWLPLALMTTIVLLLPVRSRLRKMRAKKAWASVRAVEASQECDVEKVRDATQYLGISAGPPLTPAFPTP